MSLVGASGAVSGLMGGAARLIAGRGRVGPLWSRPVLAIAGTWALINIAIAIFGSSLLPGTGGAGVGWEAPPGRVGRRPAVDHALRLAGAEGMNGHAGVR